VFLGLRNTTLIFIFCLHSYVVNSGPVASKADKNVDFFFLRVYVRGGERFKLVTSVLLDLVAAD
jgi:hypothetical protein